MGHQDTRPVLVIYRRWRRFPRDVIAIFPELDGGYPHVMMYESVGQHSAGDYGTVMRRTMPTTWDDPDVIALQAELRQIGYRLRPRQRAHWSILRTRQ